MSEHTPHSTANMLEITPVTLRRWCAAHAEFLSPGANPPERGEARRFTGRDIEVLKHIKFLRAQGKTEAKINEQLRTLTFPEIEPGDQADALTVPPASPEGPGVAQWPVPVQNDLGLRLDRLERSLVEVQGEARPRWWWFVAGVGVGLGAAVVGELFALVASRGR